MVVVVGTAALVVVVGAAVLVVDAGVEAGAAGAEVGDAGDGSVGAVATGSTTAPGLAGEHAAAIIIVATPAARTPTSL